MPIYEYRCRNCQKRFEALVRSGDIVTCEHCGSSSLDKLPSAPAMLSGRTARAPGRTCCGQEERCAAPPCSDSGACSRS